MILQAIWIASTTRGATTCTKRVGPSGAWKKPLTTSIEPASTWYSAGKDARTLATELVAMSQEEFSAAFRKSPVKRAKLAGLQRNAAVVLANSTKPGP